MKFIIVAAFFAVAVASRSQSVYKKTAYEEVTYAPQTYSYGYDIKDYDTYVDVQYAEKLDDKVTTGSYRVALPDGRTQIVTYRADKNGYSASVKYEGVAQYPEYVEKKKYRSYSDQD